jgi:hypothetical protein
MEITEPLYFNVKEFNSCRTQDFVALKHKHPTILEKTSLYASSRNQTSTRSTRKSCDVQI